jgi:hypothetical protein
MGKINNGWQDRKHVLSWFGEKERQAKTAYRRYIQEGVGQGRLPALVGGGLIRSLGGWSQVLSLRSHGKHVLTDERILGSGDFVEKLLTQADERLKYQFDRGKRRKKMEQVIEDVCEREKVNIMELRSGSRRGRNSQIRAQIASRLAGEFAVPLAEIARQLGVSTSAISKALRKISEK